MGGPGSGPQTTVLDDEEVKKLYRGIKRGLLRGEPDAQGEFLYRIDVLLLQNKITRAQHDGLTKSATVRRSVAAHAGAERRVKEVVKAAKTIENARLGGRNLRDVGPPPDALNTPDGTAEEVRDSEDGND